MVFFGVHRERYALSVISTQEMNKNNERCSPFDGTVTAKRPYSLAG
jgi:hypothetical protein